MFTTRRLKATVIATGMSFTTVAPLRYPQGEALTLQREEDPRLFPGGGL